ncbi:response regulator transcription factor [Stieleria marina]|uniref:Response regulator protein TmoT n=1 Tax=Stieleria marina TaxID=1930275 RepID=A0A517NWL9_9BACT|nr:Response regulator protein TmoT [Planctomycetes bacterium K23_9]
MFDQSTVFVVDDDSQARESVCALVQSMGIHTKSYASGEELLSDIDENARGCVVSDLRMVGMSGLELQDALRGRGNTIPLILITAHPRTSHTVRAIRRGAVSLLEKPYQDDDLWDAIREALQLCENLIDQQRQQRVLKRRLHALSEKETQVMRLMIDGAANKSIAHHLNVSVRTVENRRHDVFEKMKANSLAELVKMVVSIDDHNGQDDLTP